MLRISLIFLTVFTLFQGRVPGYGDTGSYRLAVRDLVRFSVQDEPETLVEQRIDGQGRIRVPYIGNVEVAGLTVREAEELIERIYIENQIYRHLQATVRVLEYSQKEVSVLGQVKSPGRVVFPMEVNGLDIREVISQAGGFTNIARSREVRVTRTSRDGQEELLTVNVDQMLTGRGAGSAPPFLVEPGDIIFVPERFL
jgi:protein involved in polysaccharide export with SLBB domain